jgi:GT2 family glycosyltransferase
MIDISFIILTWNSSKYLESCFTSIIKKCQIEGLHYEVIVIDNGSVDNSNKIFEEFQRNYQETFKVIFLPYNRGTTYTRNLGLKIAKGRNICILDSDTELFNGKLYNILDRLQDDKIGILAPSLLMADGKIQNSVKRFPTFIMKFVKILKAVFGVPIPNIDFYENLSIDKEMPVDSAISACWFFRKEIIEKVGFLDEKIFYSPEDLDYCIRIYKLGLQVIYYPQFTVIHHTQQISHKKPFSRNSLSHFFSLFYYFHKHGGWISNRRLIKPK